MRTTLFFMLASLVLLLSCTEQDKAERLIKEKLAARWANFEIVEIRADSANVLYADRVFGSIRLGVSSTNLEITKALIDIETRKGERTPRQNYLYIESLYNSMTDRMTDFEASRYLKKDACYYVEYLVSDGVRKSTHKEYYHLRKMGDGSYDIIYRPYDWDEYLYQSGYDKLIDKAVEYLPEIIDLRVKYGR